MIPYRHREGDWGDYWDDDDDFDPRSDDQAERDWNSSAMANYENLTDEKKYDADKRYAKIIAHGDLLTQPGDTGGWPGHQEACALWDESIRLGISLNPC